MAAKRRILVVEDDSGVITFVKDVLEAMGYQVLIARDGAAGLKTALEEKPDLMILDIMLPELDGFEVCVRLKQDAEAKKILILMLTAKSQLADRVKGLDLGADDYLLKPFEMEDFAARVRALFRRSEKPPFGGFENNTFSLQFGSQINIRSTGATAFVGVSKKAFSLDLKPYDHAGLENPTALWPNHSQAWGTQLYQTIFADHLDVLSRYREILARAQKGEAGVRLRFEAGPDFLRVPLEFCFNDLDDQGDYLILRHPFSRSVTGVTVKRDPLGGIFLNKLWDRKQKLNILLIASNTHPNIPGVDAEIELLSQSLERSFKRREIATEIVVIPTREATYETIRKRLRNCKYDIVHYAGHGYHESGAPDKSHLSFWEQDDAGGSLKEMMVSELAMLLRESNVRFVYLSVCYGAAAAQSAQPFPDDFSGVADGLIQAGVPAVLGFRWPVSDDQAQKLALTFYDVLADQGELDMALFQARQEIAAQDRDNLAWLSPFLIVQSIG